MFQKPRALNYAAQARKFLLDMAERCAAKGRLRDYEICLALAQDLEEAEHYAVPDGGLIFDDNLRIIQGETLHLPFPKITIEYFCDEEPGETLTGQRLLKITRRLVLAKEMTVEDVCDHYQNFFRRTLQSDFLASTRRLFEKGAIQVCGFFHYENIWGPCFGCWFLPVSGWDTVRGEVIDPIRAVNKKEGRLLAGRCAPLLYETYFSYVKEVGSSLAERNMASDLGPEAKVLLELLEALSCKNVGTKPIQKANPNLNARRVREGKIPFYDTSVLTVDIADRKPRVARGTLGYTRDEPCRHPRRFHPRTLPSGDKILVPSTIVNPNGPLAPKKTRVVRLNPSSK